MNWNHCPETYSTSVDSTKLQVACLQNVDALKQICRSQGLKFNDCDTAYEVELVYEHREGDDGTWYYVKWKNYSSASNTWEPYYNLTGCREMIQYYHALKSSKPKLDKKLLTFFVRDLTTRKPYDILTMTKVISHCYGISEKSVKSLKLTISQMKVKIKHILDLPSSNLKKLQNGLFYIMQFAETRKKVLINIKEWEEQINSNETHTTSYVKVENQVDLETAPNNFKFIYDYVNTIVKPKPGGPVIFCTCRDCFKEKNYCCPNDSDGIFAYNKYKRLILEPGYPIFECNDKCHCPPDCSNRVVQHGPKVKVSIFRTSNGTGWGLKILETIEKGQFIVEYLGEIITSDTAEARGNIYDYVGRSYLFDLDYGVDTMSCYTIDARHLGNAARFINHSCNPNLNVFAVWINEDDPNLPRLAFFSKRRILKGEELTFDYKMQRDYFDSENASTEGERVLCKCKAKNCRKFLY